MIRWAASSSHVRHLGRRGRVGVQGGLDHVLQRRAGRALGGFGPPVAALLGLRPGLVFGGRGSPGWPAGRARVAPSPSAGGRARHEVGRELARRASIRGRRWDQPRAERLVDPDRSRGPVASGADNRVGEPDAEARGGVLERVLYRSETATPYWCSTGPSSESHSRRGLDLVGDRDVGVQVRVAGAGVAVGNAAATRPRVSTW